MSEETNNDEILNEEEDKVERLYELGVNLVPTLGEKTQEEFDSIKKTIEKYGGEIRSFSNPVTIPLAYTMAVTVDSKKQKHNTASFGWIKFTGSTDIITSIKEDTDLNTSVLRYVILKTTGEASTESKDIAEALKEKEEAEEKPRRSRAKKEEVEEDTDSEDESVEVDEVDEAIEDLVEETK